MDERRDETWRFIHDLFASEIPEVASGVVEIRAVARRPGRRTKVAVASLDPEIDPVGACLGERSRAVQAIVARLGAERLDLFPWYNSPQRLISVALAPAKIVSMSLDDVKRRAEITVPRDQVATAMGVDGINVALASELTGWQLDVREHAA
jgi:N utilization substance protein A